MPAASAALAAFRPDDVLAGRYRLVKPLGEGGMGLVWEARQLTTDRPVALKFLKGDDASDRARFLREAKIAAGLAHRNIIQVFDFWEIEDGGPVFLVMELLNGETLHERILREGALPLEDITAILVPVARALSAAHAEGLVHRDLKPENVFLVRPKSKTAEVEIKVVDFGLARPIEAQAHVTSVTQTGAVMGTPHYMAPEQVYGERDVDAFADVWAFGVVLYECATGQKPYDGENFGQIFRRITRDAAPSARALNPDVPPEIDALVRRILVQEKSARPSMEELATLLSQPWQPWQLGPASGSGADYAIVSAASAAAAQIGTPRHGVQMNTLRLPSQPPERGFAEAATLTDGSLVRSSPRTTLDSSAPRRPRGWMPFALGVGSLAIVGALGTIAVRAGHTTASSGAAADFATRDADLVDPHAAASATTSSTALVSDGDAGPTLATSALPLAGNRPNDSRDASVAIAPGAAASSADSHGKHPPRPHDALGGGRF